MPSVSRGAAGRPSSCRRRRGVQVSAEARASDALLPRLRWQSIATFFALTVLLLAPWPALGQAFGALFSRFGNAVIIVTGVGGSAEPRFSATLPADSDAALGTGDWNVWLAATRGQTALPLPLETRILGYTPIALLLALTLAFAVPWRRKLRMLGIGLALLLVRLAIAIALPVGRAFSARRAPPGPITEIVWYVLIDLPAMSYVAPLFGWWIAFTLTHD